MCILTMLLTSSWTALYAQTGNTDTLTCYTNEELQKIASKVIYASECDTLLSIAEQQLLLSKETNDKLLLVIDKKDSSLLYKDEIITSKDAIINIHVEDLKLERKRHKITKVGWISTSAGLFALVLAALFR